jgi:hypothetical protein
MLEEKDRPTHTTTPHHTTHSDRNPKNKKQWKENSKQNERCFHSTHS